MSARIKKLKKMKKVARRAMETELSDMSAYFYKKYIFYKWASVALLISFIISIVYFSTQNY